MFERFTDRARRVLVAAQEESRQLGHAVIGSDHLLLALAAERQGVAGVALGSLGFDLDRARGAARTLRPQPDTPVVTPPFTPRAKRALEASLKQALKLGHDYIGTEHLLLGTVAVADSDACRLLGDQAIELEAVRGAVLTALRGAPD